VSLARTSCEEALRADDGLHVYLAHVKATDPINRVAWVDNSRSLALRPRQNDIDEVLRQEGSHAASARSRALHIVAHTAFCWRPTLRDQAGRAAVQARAYCSCRYGRYGFEIVDRHGCDAVGPLLLQRAPNHNSL
jgi:hypothetical protein